MLEVKGIFEIEGKTYYGYKIKQAILDLDSDLIGMVVLYFDNGHDVDFIKTHWFKSQEDNDINLLIDKTHQVHTKWQTNYTED